MKTDAIRKCIEITDDESCGGGDYCGLQALAATIELVALEKRLAELEAFEANHNIDLPREERIAFEPGGFDGTKTNPLTGGPRYEPGECERRGYPPTEAERMEERGTNEN